jgi:hypothetical protein
MAGRRLIFAALSAVLMTVAGAAHAESKGSPVSPADSFTVRDSFAADPNAWGPQVGRRSLQWDSKKAKWGLKLDMDQELGLPPNYSNRDVQAGAFYKITPSFRVGGSLRFGVTNDGVQPVIPTDKTPRVRLETALKF